MARNTLTSRLWTARQLLHHFGAGWLLRRCVYRLKLRSGWAERKSPARTWEEFPFAPSLAEANLADTQVYGEYRRSDAPSFFFAPTDGARYRSLFERWSCAGRDQPCEADRVRAGEFRLFSHDCVKVGLPPDWHANPYSGERFPANVHWSRIADFDHGDVKAVWELSRFTFTFPLVRAYWRSGDESYAETFWRLVASWQTQNLPFQGSHWKCGQEVSLRVMAWCFGLYGFSGCPASSDERVTQLAKMIMVSGQRIAANLEYALSQQNNHGVSEAAGLWTIGVLFPEFPEAERWRQTGRDLLESLGRSLIYDDGGFSQHSFNYQRLVLHLYLWCLRLADVHHETFSDELKQRLGQSARLLYQVQDPSSGQVPCYGQNDGALLLPLNSCDYRDFRPVIQAVHFLLSGHRGYETGPWDEDLLWLFGPESLQAPVEIGQREDLASRPGGYSTIRSPQSHVFTRCARFRHRPGQADLLHIDLWWRGQNIAMDAGTYSYNAPAPWDNPLAGTAFHNTVTVDGQDQMQRVGRFVWLPWLRGHSSGCRYSAQRDLCAWEGEHDGYRRLRAPVAYRRAVLRMGDEHWLIADRLCSQALHEYRLHWLIMDARHRWDGEENRLSLETDNGAYHVQVGSSASRAQATLVRADPDSPRGWRAPYYHHREPALSLDFKGRDQDLVFWTLFGPQPYSVNHPGRELQVETDLFQARIMLGATAEEPLIESATLSGRLADSLPIDK